MIQRFLSALSGRTSTTPSPGGMDLVPVLKELRRSKDTVGERNRESGPGGMHSPFNNGFFKPMSVAFPELAPGFKPENLDDINNRLFPGMSPEERGAAYRIGGPTPAERVGRHPNDAAIGLVPQSTERVGPDGMAVGRDLYSPYAAGGIRGSSTFETPQAPIGTREVGTDPSMIQAFLANPAFATAQSQQMVNNVGSAAPAPASQPAPAPVPSGPQPGGLMPGALPVSSGQLNIFSILSRLLGR